MEQKYENLEHEINDLKQDLENFQQEKERVRAIIGKIGGVPKYRTKIVNILFLIVIIASIIASTVAGDKLRLLMIELAMVALSLKIIYLVNLLMRMDHFKFWILSSIEWRINEMINLIKNQKRQSQ
jgi:hypothetical protein